MMTPDNEHFNCWGLSPLVKECYRENQAMFRFELEVAKAIHGDAMRQFIKDIESAVEDA